MMTIALTLVLSGLALTVFFYLTWRFPLFGKALVAQPLRILSTSCEQVAHTCKKGMENALDVWGKAASDEERHDIGTIIMRNVYLVTSAILAYVEYPMVKLRFAHFLG